MTAVKKQKKPNLLNDYHLLSFDSLDSTNEEAKRIARAGGGHGAVIWAKRQTEGKGRMGRGWISSDGNLFVSLLLKPEKPLEELSQLSFVTAVAAIESMLPLLSNHVRLQCKWPNDILVDGRKLGGILLESFQVPEKKENWVVIGLGLNIDSFPPRTEFPATCLKDAGVELISAKIILSRFIHHFIEAYNHWDAKGFAVIRTKWQRHAWGMGERLCARLPDGEIEGIAEGIDAHGSLILKLDNGKKRQVHAGDVFPAEPVKA